MIWQNKTEDRLQELFASAPVVKKGKIEYINMAISFDIESTSYIDSAGEKCGIMYVWAMCIDGYYFTGRTWSEWLDLLKKLTAVLKVSPTRHMLIFIHNLGFEMQWIKEFFGWSKILANRILKPITAITTSGIEFRCSYLLSGYSLGTLADIYLHNRVKKLTGDLDYTLKRHSETRLTRKEYQYLYNDVRIVYEYINLKMSEEKNIAFIPNTKTGYIRRMIKYNCIGGPPVRGMRRSTQERNYSALMRYLTINSEDEYRQLESGFQGGYTHTSCWNEGKVFKDCASFDLSSAYPTMMISQMYPMSPARIVHPKSMEEVNGYLNKFCCLFDVEFIGLKASIIYEHYISASKCILEGHYILDNGRIVEADSATTTITNLDFDIIRDTYTWEHIKIGRFRVYNPGYLPTPLVKTILELYKVKTELKGVVGREAEYQAAKENINSVFGATCMKVQHPDYTIENGEWKTIEPQLADVLDKYNRSWNRTLFFPWALWITGWTRWHLWKYGIMKFGCDYYYSDTDSCKVGNYNTPEHKRAIKEYNDKITEDIRKALAFHGIPFEWSRPKTIKGERKPLGIFEFEGACEFKALRAKCYMVKKNNKYNITVSGLAKTRVVPYLHKEYGAELFDVFKDGLYIPKGATGKMTHTYIDERRSGWFIDYQGNRGEYDERSGVYLEASDYHLGMDDEWLDWILEVQYYGEY